MPPKATRPAGQRSAVRTTKSLPSLYRSLRHDVTIREFRLPNVPFRQFAPYSPMRGSISPKWTIFVCQVVILGSGLVCIPTLRVCFETQPQRDACRLHRLPHYRYQFSIQAVQVRLISQSGGEGFEGLSRVVLAAVEAAVYERLDAPSQGVEQRGYHQGRDDHGELGLLLLASEGAEDGLGRCHAPEVNERQHRGEGAVDEGTIYDHVYVEEAGAQDGDPDGERDEQHECVHQQHAKHLRSNLFGREVDRRPHGEDSRKDTGHCHSDTEHHPLGLLAL